MPRGRMTFRYVFGNRDAVRPDVSMEAVRMKEDIEIKSDRVGERQGGTVQISMAFNTGRDAGYDPGCRMG